MGYLQYTLSRHGWEPNRKKPDFRTRFQTRAGKYLFLSKLLPQYNYRDRSLLTKVMGFKFVLHPSMLQYKSRSYNHFFYINLFIQHWWDTEVKDVCTPLCQGSIIGNTWQMTFTRPWEIVGIASKKSRLRNDDTRTTISSKYPIGNFHDGHLRPLPKTFNADQLVLVMMNHYSKLTRAVLRPKTTTSLVESLLMNRW